MHVKDPIEFWLPDDPPRVDRVPLWPDRDVLVVRDDLLHPVAGGNKLRKLDAIWPAVVRAGARGVVTCGGAQSAHAAAVAVLAAESGIRAHLLLRGEPPSIPTGYTLLSMIYGEVTWVSRQEYADREAMFARFLARRDPDGQNRDGQNRDDQDLERAVHDLKDPDQDLLVIPEGAGGSGAVHGLIRLIRLLKEELGDEPYRLIVDSGTGTTAVGLALGILSEELPWRVDGVMLLRDPGPCREQAERLLAEFRTANPATPGSSADLPLRWVPRAQPRRFGKVLPAEVAECVRIARRTGVLFDPIYTLASAQHVLTLDEENELEPVIVHTGGTLNLFGVAQRVGADVWMVE